MVIGCPIITQISNQYNDSLLPYTVQGAIHHDRSTHRLPARRSGQDHRDRRRPGGQAQSHEPRTRCGQHGRAHATLGLQGPHPHQARRDLGGHRLQARREDPGGQGLTMELVLVGQPYSGKSTLFNEMVGYRSVAVTCRTIA